MIILPDSVQTLPVPRPRQELQKISPRHEAMINLLINEPDLTRYQIGARLGLTASWVSACMSSPAFKERFLERQAEVVDPILFQSINERFEGMLLRLIEVINEKLNQEHVPDKFALRAFELTLRAAGYGGGNSPVAPVSGGAVHQHLESMASNLVTLLRTERSKVVMTVETSKTVEVAK
jgi:hypothetical protein